MLWEFWVQDPQIERGALVGSLTCSRVESGPLRRPGGWLGVEGPACAWCGVHAPAAGLAPGAGKRHGSLGRNNVLIKKESCWPQGPERRQVDKKSWLWGQCAHVSLGGAVL